MTIKRTPPSESSEFNDFPNTVSHPTHKLCESLTGHFSACILSKQITDDSDTVSNEIKRGHHCAKYISNSLRCAKKDITNVQECKLLKGWGGGFVFLMINGKL